MSNPLSLSIFSEAVCLVDFPIMVNSDFFFFVSFSWLKLSPTFSFSYFWIMYRSASKSNFSFSVLSIKSLTKDTNCWVNFLSVGKMACPKYLFANFVLSGSISKLINSAVSMLSSTDDFDFWLTEEEEWKEEKMEPTSVLICGWSFNEEERRDSWEGVWKSEVFNQAWKS